MHTVLPQPSGMTDPFVSLSSPTTDGSNNADPFASLSSPTTDGFNNTNPSVNPFDAISASQGTLDQGSGPLVSSDPADSFDLTTISATVPSVPANPTTNTTSMMTPTTNFTNMMTLTTPDTTSESIPVVTPNIANQKFEMPSPDAVAVGNQSMDSPPILPLSDTPPVPPTEAPQVLPLVEANASTDPWARVLSPAVSPPGEIPNEASQVPPFVEVNASTDPWAGVISPAVSPPAIPPPSVPPPAVPPPAVPSPSVPLSAQNDDPFGVILGQAPVSTGSAASEALLPAGNLSDPWATTPGATQNPTIQNNYDPFAGAIDQSPALSAGSNPQQQQQVPEGLQDGADDFWASMGSPPEKPISTNEEQQKISVRSELSFDKNNLPNGGSSYTARVASDSLGVVFFKACDLSQTLFRDATPGALDALAARPVVAHVFDGSAAYSAGIEVGSILLSINGKAVMTTEEATSLIKKSPRPFTVECYDVTKCEHLPVSINTGMHMVKYDSPDKLAPKKRRDWKPKFVVVGGVIAQPYHMNMYRSRAEYDTAVRETMNGLDRVSVKVKHFSLVGAKVPNLRNRKTFLVQYNAETWSYIIVQPFKGYPIKIAGKNDEAVESVHEGIRHALLLDQRMEELEESYQAELSERYRGDSSNNSQSSSEGGPSWADLMGPDS